MPAFFLVDIREIKDAAQMAEYRARVKSVVEKFGGRYVIIGGPFEIVEGDHHFKFPVMIQFPSMEQARNWYDSEEYRDLKRQRLAASVSNAVLMAGV